jgi:Protein  of unknown function (DUF3018)
MTSPIAIRVRKHRESLRAAGLRPVRMWVPDTRQPGFAVECGRQTRAVIAGAKAGAEAELQSWLEQLADTDGWH